jgi:hypothetical protein
MKIRKFLILLIGVFAMVAMLVSCTSGRATFTTPSLQGRAIETTMIEVTGDKGEKLRVQLNRETGICEQIWVNDEKRDCNAKDIVIPMKETYFCIPEDDKHPANTDMNNDGKPDTYCGIVKFLTDGADIQFEADSKAGNRKCKKIGGKWYCYP